MKNTRVEWQEPRQSVCGGQEVFDIIAERDDTDQTGWAFYEKSSWDIMWVRIPATLARLSRALIESTEKEAGESVAKPHP